MVLQVGGLGQLKLDLLADGGVDGSAEATVRGQGHVQDLGIALLGGFDLGVLVESLGTLSVGPSNLYE